MRYAVRLIAVFAVTALASLFSFSPQPFFFSTLFTVVGIFFSIGFSIVIGFDFSAITNDSLVKGLRRRLKQIEHSFTIHFAIATGAFFLADQNPKPITIKGFCFSFIALSVVSSLYILIYLIVNFSRLQRLKDEVSDLIRHSRAQEKS